LRLNSATGAPTHWQAVDLPGRKRLLIGSPCRTAIGLNYPDQFFEGRPSSVGRHADDSDHAAHLVARTALPRHHTAAGPMVTTCDVEGHDVLAMLYWSAEAIHSARGPLRLRMPGPDPHGSTGRVSGQSFLTGASVPVGDAFVHWYNFDHRHSGIRYVSPAQRHAGEDHPILAARHAVYLEARAQNPARWSRHTRNWTPIGAVTLNPEKDSVVGIVSKSTNQTALAA
jgi:hypothetical protein